MASTSAPGERFTTSIRAADDTPPLRESTVGSALRDAAAAWPAQTALLANRAARPDVGSGRWSFGDLAEEAERAARALLGRFAPGERIAVWAPNVAEFFLIQLGAALARLTLVPVPLALRARELAYMLGQSGAQGLFLVPSWRGVAMAETAASVRHALPVLREIVDFTAWEEFLASASTSERLPVVGPRDAAEILYTSGSTGLPKGAVVHHLGITNSSRFVAERMGVVEGDVFLNFMPLSYVAGNAITALAALQSGATQVLTDFEPRRVIDVVQSERCTAALAGVAMIRMLVEELTHRSSRPTSLRTVAVGGSTLPIELARRAEEALGAPLSVIFGLTETCGIAIQTRYDDPADERIATIGTPHPHLDARVVDRSGEIVPVGTVGELQLRGYALMRGYFDLPAATAEATADDGWLHTGDLATMDERGAFRIEGRLKEIINRGGRKIAPGEIEALLLSHPAVAAAAVVAVPDDRLGEEIAAFVKLAPSAIVAPDELTALCHGRLAPYKTPRHWVVVDEMPVTAAGKVRKFVLREQFLAGRLRPLERGDAAAT